MLIPISLVIAAAIYIIACAADDYYQGNFWFQTDKK